MAEKSAPSQTQMLIRAMDDGLKLTKLQALSLIGTMNLGARVLELRRSGYPVQTQMIEVPRTKKRVALYSFADRACPCDPFEDCERCEFVREIISERRNHG